MNIRGVLDRIASLSSFNPELDSYDVEVRDEFNEVYISFFTEVPYLFSQKVVHLWTLDDITTTADIDATDPTLLFIDGLADPAVLQMPQYEGCILRLSGSENDLDNCEYWVDKIDDAGIWVRRMTGDDRDGWHLTMADVTITITQRYIDLPEDCSQTLDVSHLVGDTVYDLVTRTRGQLERYNPTTSGTPGEWAEYDAYPGGADALWDVLPQLDDLTMTAAGVGIGDGWPEGDYTFYYGHYHHGKLGPLSGGVALTIAVDEVPSFQTIDTTAAGWWGIRMVFYVRMDDIANYDEDIIRRLSEYDSGTADITCDGFREFVVADDDAVTEDWNAALPHSLAFLKNLPRAPENGGEYKRIRVHPYLASSGHLRVRYIRRPRRLVEDQDVPECPVDTHRYLVYRTLESMLVKHCEFDAAMVWGAKADKELEWIQQKYLTQRDGHYVMGNWGSEAVATGKPTITYGG